ncbi:MAG: type II toxin-antitoxin system CcdA family antitoxin [Candidatus Dormibacteraceae bacterium]
MKKRRITLNLDADVVEALEAQGGRSLSAVANSALRQAVADEAQRQATLHWLDELDAKYGAPTKEQLAQADRFLDALERGDLIEQDGKYKSNAA